MVGLIIGIVTFIILGIFLLNGKGSFLIAGYNMMSKEEKDKYDKLALSKFMGKVMFFFAFSMSFWALGEALESNILFSIGLVLFFGIILFTLIYTNTGNRFKK